jgi:hypothetical protein
MTTRETLVLGDLTFKIWEYGAVVVTGTDVDTEEAWVHHISRHDLEKYKQVIEKALAKRNSWRRDSGQN